MISSSLGTWSAILPTTLEMYKVAALGLQRKVTKSVPPAPPVPGPDIRFEAPAPTAQHIRQFVRVCRGNPGAYKGAVPPAMFCIWGLNVVSRSLANTPWDLVSALHVGAELRVNAPIKAGETILVSGRLAEIDEDERRVVMKQHVVMGDRHNPNAWEATITEFAPKPRPKGERKGGPMKAPETIPQDAREIDTWKLRANAGIEYARVGGDFNPLHWVKPAARAMGFKTTFLQGFGILSFAVESLVRSEAYGEPGRLAAIDIRFLKPVFFPGTYKVFVKDGQYFIGLAPGADIRAAGHYHIT